MTRLETTIRQVSDLRDFYLKIGRRSGPLELGEKALAAMKGAARRVAEEQRRAGIPLVIRENGRIVRQRVEEPGTRVVELFGAVDFDPAYGSKRQRRRA